jgi:hypothetical protein
MKNFTHSLLFFSDLRAVGASRAILPVGVQGWKKHKARSAEFTPSEVTLMPLGESFSRTDVKQVVIRANRGFCCDAIHWPEAPFLFGDILDGPAGAVALIVLVPVEAGLIAISLPVAAVQGIKRLKPAEILYEVVP